MKLINGTSQEQADEFSMFVDVVIAAHRRGWRMAANPRDVEQAVAGLEAVAEHERWFFDKGPQLELHDDVPRGRIGFFDPRARMLTGLMSKVTNSNKGLGRFKKFWLPRNPDIG